MLARVYAPWFGPPRRRPARRARPRGGGGTRAPAEARARAPPRPALDRLGPPPGALERPGGRRRPASPRERQRRAPWWGSTCCTTWPPPPPSSARRRASCAPGGRLALVEPWITPFSWADLPLPPPGGLPPVGRPLAPLPRRRARTASTATPPCRGSLVRDTPAGRWRDLGLGAAARRAAERLRLPAEPRLPARLAAARAARARAHGARPRERAPGAAPGLRGSRVDGGRRALTSRLDKA